VLLGGDRPDPEILADSFRARWSRRNFHERPRNHGFAIARLSARGCVGFCHTDFVDGQIHIEGLEVSARIGVPEEERAAVQRLTFNVTCWPVRPMEELNDEIKRAVNYAAVCAELRKFVEHSEFKLIETLANSLALHLLARFDIQRVTVELRKFILPEVEFVSVKVTRER
jgi:FolB domain-containing protein